MAMSKDFFDIKRFGGYFLYDLQKAWKSVGLSAVLLGLIPVLSYGFRLFYVSILKHADVGADADVYLFTSMVCGIMALSIWLIMMTLIIPVKLYGRLTDKRAGSLFLMLPASSFEKFLSMVLIAGIIVPATSAAVFFGIDRLLGLIPSYGPDMLSAYGQMFKLSGSSFDFRPWLGMCLLSHFYNFILFTLGAVFFKKSKAAKTLLCMMVISIIVSKVNGVSAVAGDLMGITRLGTADLTTIMDRLAGASYIAYGILSVLALAGLYFRIKTLKH